MRFAYMDSQGNEVTIPSVDALALRIELGAISADTELYDAQADRWGPAHTHDIFHTLSRDAEEEGFVAPPPAMAPPTPAIDPPPAIESPPAEEAEPERQPERSLDAVAEEPEADIGLDDIDLSLTDAGEKSLGNMGLDLAPEVAADAPGDEDGGFDFGDFSGLIEEELSFGTEVEPEEDADALSADLGGGLDVPMDPAADGMDLQSPMDYAGEVESGSSAGALEVDPPPAERTPEDSSEWQQEEVDDGAMEFGGATSSRTLDSSAGDERPSRRKPRSRPSAPRRPRKSPVPFIIGAVVVSGLGAGGYFTWQAFAGEPVIEVPALPAVVIPDIPAELLPRMRDMAEAAVIEMVEDLRGRSAALEIPAEPDDAWLGGNYLSNASQFESIKQFWIGIERFVDDVRDTDTQLFHDRYVSQVEVAGIAADTAAMLIERADSGFVAARDGRFEAYSLMDDLLNAALDLHAFLISNEQQIEYDPASSGLSRDPVLEAVPATEELGDEMWALVGGITDALAELGTLDRVTRERLFAVLFDRIRSAGIK